MNDKTKLNKLKEKYNISDEVFSVILESFNLKENEFLDYAKLAKQKRLEFFKATERAYFNL